MLGDQRLDYEAFLQGRVPIILLPLDGSSQARAAVPLAGLLANILGAMVHVVHITDETLPTDKLMTHLGLTKEETKRAILDQIKGSPADSIVKLAIEKRAMLIVMSQRGSKTPPERVFGSVVRQVVQDAPCPIVLVRPEIASLLASISKIKKMLLPLDGAPSTAAVIGPAHELAHRANAELDFLYVLEPGAKKPEEAGTIVSPRYTDQPQHEWPAWTEEFLQRFNICPPGTFHPAARTRMFLRTGSPVAEILNYTRSQNVDLIVLEWRGQMDTNHALVVQGVLKDSPVPVLLLRVKT